MTTEPVRLDDELLRAYDGSAWHGPSFREALAGVTADVAARRHPTLAHSIWQVVAHTSTWVDVVRRRVVEGRAVDVADAENFPAAPDPSPAAWETTLRDLDHRVRDLRVVVAGLDPGRLDQIVPGKDYSVAVMLHGTAQHLAYHAGQIALLVRLVG